MYLIVDIETAPDTSIWTRPDAVVTAASPNGGTTITVNDPFPPHHAHRVICIGFALLTAEYALVELGAFTIGRGLRQVDLFATPAERDQDADESELLFAFSRRVNDAQRKAREDKGSLTVVGFNSRGFDMSVLVLRALKHGVPLPWMFRERAFNIRYEERGHLDLCDAISNFGAAKMTKLDTLAKLIGLPGKLGVDGSQVAGLYEQGRIDEIAAYCCADVAQTALLLLRWRLIQYELTLPAYQDAERALRAALGNDPRLAQLFGQPAIQQASNA